MTLALYAVFSVVPYHVDFYRRYFCLKPTLSLAICRSWTFNFAFSLVHSHYLRFPLKTRTMTEKYINAFSSILPCPFWACRSSSAYLIKHITFSHIHGLFAILNTRKPSTSSFQIFSNVCVSTSRQFWLPISSSTFRFLLIGIFRFVRAHKVSIFRNMLYPSKFYVWL